MEPCLRILLVVSGFPSAEKPFNGIFSLRFAKKLAKIADVTVVHLRAWLPGRPMISDSEREGLQVRTIACPQLQSFSVASISLCRQLGWPLVRTLVRQCDLIHSVGVDFAGPVASAWAQRGRKHHVTQAIGSDLAVALPRIRDARLIRGWENYVHGVVCNSVALARNFSAQYPNSKNVCAIHRGVDLEYFQSAGPIDGPLAERPPVRYLFLGGFPENGKDSFHTNIKGGDTLLEAWKAGEDDLAHDGASLLVAGPLPKDDRLSRWRMTLRFPDQVHIAGSLRPESVPSYIRSCDAVLMPSLREGLPNVALEASACSRPVFGSNIEGIADAVVHKKTGLLIPAGDAGAWKLELVKYASQIACLRMMGEAARRRMEKTFDAGNYVPEMLNLYRAALTEAIT
jgi:glycosyltransferase involved in cell wall biosynthesis